MTNKQQLESELEEARLSLIEAQHKEILYYKVSRRSQKRATQWGDKHRDTMAKIVELKREIAKCNDD